MTVVEKAILSTDLALYFRKKAVFQEVSNAGEIDWQGEEKKDCKIMSIGLIKCISFILNLIFIFLNKEIISFDKCQLLVVLCGMLMTACDVSAIAKPWEIQHGLAKKVADEFFDQGDMEKVRLNAQPIVR